MRFHTRGAIPTAKSCRLEMTAVGIFAGRGDVLVAMGLALIIGIWAGWQSRRLIEWVRSKTTK